MMHMLNIIMFPWYESLSKLTTYTQSEMAEAKNHVKIRIMLSEEASGMHLIKA